MGLFLFPHLYLTRIQRFSCVDECVWELTPKTPKKITIQWSCWILMQLKRLPSKVSFVFTIYWNNSRQLRIKTVQIMGHKTDAEYDEIIVIWQLSPHKAELQSTYSWTRTWSMAQFSWSLPLALRARWLVIIHKLRSNGSEFSSKLVVLCTENHWRVVRN